MPSLSQAQQRLMAIGEHNPSKVFKQNRGILKMSQLQLHDFAASPRSALPERVGAARAVGASRATNVIKPKRIKSLYARIAHNVKNVQSRGVPSLS